MMKLLVNLKDLSISASYYLPEGPEGAGTGKWPVHHDDVRILHGCPFKLERLACIFTWGEPFARWLATQPQLVAFEHDGYCDLHASASGGTGMARLADALRDAALLRCAYLRISPHILACFNGRAEKPRPVALRFDIRFNTVQQEYDAARGLRDICRNLKCLTLTRQTLTEEYLSTSRILKAFAHRAPNLTCLAIYENIDYVRLEHSSFVWHIVYNHLQSAGENKRILRVIKENFAKLQVFVWAPLNYPVTQDEEDGFTSSSSGFSIDSCTEEEEYSFDKTERYAFAMFDAVPSMCMFISFRKGPCYVWRRGPAAGEPGEARSFRRAWLSICLSEDTFRTVDPDHPMELFVTNIPHGPPLAEPRVTYIYDAPISLPISRSINTYQNL